jgi:hypothetical protein
MSAKMKKVSGKIKTWHIVADIARVYWVCLYRPCLVGRMSQNNGVKPGSTHAGFIWHMCCLVFESSAPEQVASTLYIYIGHPGYLDVGPKQICTPPYTLYQQSNVSIYHVCLHTTYMWVASNNIRGLSPFSTYFTVSPGLSMSTRGLASLSENLVSP